MQKQFHNVVHYFIYFGIQNIDTKHSLLVNPAPLPQSQEDDVDMATNTQSISLREHLYYLVDSSGEPLIHACYPTGNPHKFFILFQIEKKQKS